MAYLTFNDMWRVAKTSLGSWSALGILTGAITITNIFVRHGYLNIKGIISNWLSYYNKFFHSDVDAITLWLCQINNWPPITIPPNVKDITYALIVFIPTAIRAYSVAHNVGIKDVFIYVEGASKVMKPVDEEKLINFAIWWAFQLLAFSIIIQTSASLIVVFFFVLFGAYS